MPVGYPDFIEIGPFWAGIKLTKVKIYSTNFK